MKVGDLLQCKTTGRMGLLAEHAPTKYGDAWIKIWFGDALSKWKSAQEYKLVERNNNGLR